MNRTGSCLILALLFFANSFVSAQTFHVSSFAKKSGLPSSLLFDVYEDSTGLLWLASEKGLIRFDGRQFVIFDPEKYRKIVQVSEAEAAAIGTNKVVSLVNGKSPDLNRFDFLQGKGLKGANILQVIETGNKTFWMLTDDALFKIENRTLSEVPIKGFEGSYNECLLGAGEGVLKLISSQGNIYQWDEQAKEFASQALGRSFTELKKYISYHDSISFILDGSQVFQLDHDLKITTPAWIGLPVNINVTDITVLDKSLMIGTSQGLWLGKRSAKGFVFTRVLNGNEPHRVAELPFHSIDKIFCSPGGNVWVLSEGNLWLLRQRAFKRVSMDIPMASFEQAVFLDNGKIYLDSENGLFECYSTGENEFTGNVANIGLNILQSAIAGYRNGLWIASIDNKVYYYENNALRKAVDLNYRGDIIFNLYTDSKGNLWTFQAPDKEPIIGLLKITPELKTVDYGEQAGFASRMLAVKESPSGILYCAGIGENSYLYEYDQARDRFVNISATMMFDYGENFEVHDLSIAKDGTIWLASTAGLLRYKDRQVEKIWIEELYENEAVAVVAAQDGSVWFSTDSRGVVQYNNGHYTIFDQKAGLASNFMTYRSISEPVPGTIWIGTREGILFSSPDFRPKKKTKTPMLLSVRNLKGDSDPDHNFSYNSDLIVDFVSPEHPGETVQYTYKLDGYNNNRWTNLMAYDSLMISNLKNGKYILEIKAKQVGGYNWSDPLVYNFTVEQVWYFKPLAVILYIIGAGLITVAGILIYNRGLLKEKELLERKVSDRTREIARKNEEILAQNEEITAQMEEITSQVEELRRVNEEVATQRDQTIKQKEIIEEQNNLLAEAKTELEHKVKERTVELSLSNQELVEHNIQLEQFTFMTAHNLRAPVARLLGLTTIFNAKDIADPVNIEIISKIHKSAKDLDEIIRDISTILQVKRSVSETFTTVQVQPVLQKVMDSFKAEIENKKIRIVDTIKPSDAIHGIEPYIYSVFYNILSNSIKYADIRKTPEIRIESAESNGIIRLTFSDNGIGFDGSNHREKLFKPFSRLNSITEGKGLGLYLMKIEMDAMRASIEIESVINYGTKVVLMFNKA